MNTIMLHSRVEGWPCRRGKVRDVYDLGDRLVLVATDRISAFDHVLRNGVPSKGIILTDLTVLWLRLLKEPNHLISTDLSTMPAEFSSHPEPLTGRTMLVHKTEVVPIECVVRGYLAGSAWKEYRSHGRVCGIALTAGLRQSEALPEAIFTPATKASSGHDVNISFAEMVQLVGEAVAEELRDRTLALYRRASAMAQRCGLIVADTKLEWGRRPSGELILIDEVLTPDSSRYWPIENYQPGQAIASLDKQAVRDWLEASGWDQHSPPPLLPDDVVARTLSHYQAVRDRLRPLLDAV